MKELFLTPKQTEIMRISTHEPKRWNISVGAVRSGKTYLDYYRIPNRILAADGKGAVALVGNTEGSVARNIIDPMRQMFGEKLVGRVKSGGTVRLFGRECFIFGAYRSGCADKMQGLSLSYCYGDEMTTWNEDVFKMIMSRLDRPNSIFDGSCNPASPNHWLKRFIDEGVKNGSVRASHFTIDDNPTLMPSFVRTLKLNYAGSVYYDRFILGKWISAEGVIYRDFADSTGDFILKRINPGDIIMADVGVDFGGNGSATAFNLTGYTAGYKKIITLDEYYKKGIVSPAELERDFVRFIRKCLKSYPCLRDVYCDSAEQVLIRGLQNAARREQLPVEIHNARKGDIGQRIRFYTSMMSCGQYKIAARCVNTIKAFSEAVWEQGGTDRRLDDGSVNVDSLDAQEYSTERRMNDILGAQK
ncbi:MAG: PBSX family phage terminase large subunit [Oscillospiraceae bacterium]|nr:PBSX family phage terminase large subunit [Oscillospiraceae bacterium]